MVAAIAAEAVLGEIGAEIGEPAQGRVHLVVARVEHGDRADARAHDGALEVAGRLDERGRHVGTVERGLDPYAAVAHAEERAATDLEKKLRDERGGLLLDRHRLSGAARFGSLAEEAVVQVEVGERAIDAQPVAAQAGALRRAHGPAAARGIARRDRGVG